MTELDVDRFRDALQKERKRIVDAIDYLHSENPGSSDTTALESLLDNHMAETASETLDREIDDTLEENAERLLTEVDGALERIEQGTYGRCVNCGNEIAVERLEAIPYAALCIDCKRKEAA